MNARRLGRPWVAIGLTALLLSIASTATARDIRFELKVAGDRGEPIDGATIWFLCETSDRRDLRVDDLQRMVKRYHRDVDFVFEKSLHPELLIERTRAGIAMIRMDDADRGNLPSVRMSIAVIKRGWKPEVLSSAGRNGQTVKLSVQLKRDASWAADPRLEELDRSRAIAEAGLAEEMTAQSQKHLSDIATRLRALAGELEREGLSDAAAAVYYNLAYLPSVTVDAGDSGGLAIRGYTRGFDADSPQRVADRAHAWILVRARPALEYQRLLATHMANGMGGPPSASRTGIRRQYIDDTERFFREFPEQMWPMFHIHLWQMQVSLGNADLACDALKKFHDFEPSFYNASGWKRRLMDYEADVRLFRATPTRPCEIQNLRADAG